MITQLIVNSITFFSKKCRRKKHKRTQYFFLKSLLKFMEKTKTAQKAFFVDKV